MSRHINALSLAIVLAAIVSRTVAAADAPAEEAQVSLPTAGPSRMH